MIKTTGIVYSHRTRYFKCDYRQWLLARYSRKLHNLIVAYEIQNQQLREANEQMRVDLRIAYEAKHNRKAQPC